RGGREHRRRDDLRELRRRREAPLARRPESLPRQRHGRRRAEPDRRPRAHGRRRRPEEELERSGGGGVGRDSRPAPREAGRGGEEEAREEGQVRGPERESLPGRPSRGDPTVTAYSEKITLITGNANPELGRAISKELAIP